MTTQQRILEHMRPPGWERLSDSAQIAVIDALADLPEDQDAPAPACARVNLVIDAIRRVAAREDIAPGDRDLIASWQALRYAAAITAYLDFATLAARGLVLADDSSKGRAS